jgi:peptidoglycan hydrolase-like protein with peptidoglycan-binding domain
MNFDIGGIDGYYGKKTRDAVKAFQKANDLKQTGIADVKTQALLYGDIVEEPEEPAVVDNKEAILEQIDKLREMVKGL